MDYSSDLDALVGGFDDLDIEGDGRFEAHNDNSCEACYNSDSESGDMTCAICLHSIDLPDMAMVKGCDHLYCAQCILQWTLHRSESVCPTCKRPFSYLLTYRALDGTLNDFPMEESVVLLRRSQWFEEWVRESQNTSCQSLFEDAKIADDTKWMDEFDEDEYWEEDEKMEAFYFSSAAGKARIVLGNRRFGQGGYISGGYRQARPVHNNKNTPGTSGPGSTSKQTKQQKSKKMKNKGMVKASMKEIRPEMSKAIVINTPNSQLGKEPVRPFDDQYGSSPASSLGGTGILGSSPSGFGRRAKRNARRNAEKSQLSESVETEQFHAIWSINIE
jgi:hypothetical protein